MAGADVRGRRAEQRKHGVDSGVLGDPRLWLHVSWQCACGKGSRHVRLRHCKCIPVILARIPTRVQTVARQHQHHCNTTTAHKHRKRLCPKPSTLNPKPFALQASLPTLLPSIPSLTVLLVEAWWQPQLVARARGCWEWLRCWRIRAPTSGFVFVQDTFQQTKRTRSDQIIHQPLHQS